MCNYGSEMNSLLSCLEGMEKKILCYVNYDENILQCVVLPNVDPELFNVNLVHLIFVHSK